MTSQVEVPPLTGLIHFISGKRRVKVLSKYEVYGIQKLILLFFRENITFGISYYVF